MSNLTSLIKIELKQSFSANSRSKKASSFVSMIFLGIILVFASAIIGFSYCEVARLGEMEYKYINTLPFVYSIFLIFNQSLINIKRVFIGKDFDLLESMPIKKRDIIVAKIINIYLVGLFYSACFQLPSSIVCAVYDGWIYALKGVFDSVLVPIFPIVIAALLSTIISYISTKAKKFSSVVDFIFNLITALGFVAICFVISFSTSYSSQESINSNVFDNMHWVNPTYFFSLKSLDDPIYLLVYLAINILGFFLMASFIGLFYNKLHELMNASKSNVKYVRKELKQKLEFRTLIDFEIKKFMKSKMYLLNSVMGGFIGIVIAIGICYALRTQSFTIEGVEDISPYISKYGFLSVIIINYMLGINVPGQALVSLEGKAFESLKSMPINPKKWINAKILIASCVSIFFSIIISLILISSAVFSLFSCIMIFIIPILFMISQNIILLYLDLRNPKLNWIDEHGMNKQANSGLAVLLDLVEIFIDAIILILISMFNVYLACGIYILLHVTLIITFYLLINNNVEKYFNKIG